MMQCNRIVANVFRKYLQPLGITDSQLSILFVVTKGKSVNQKKLSDFLYLDKSTVNRNITRLFKEGYIYREETKFLHTTKKGKQFLEKVVPQWDLAMEEIREILGKEGEYALLLLKNKLSA